MTSNTNPNTLKPLADLNLLDDFLFFTLASHEEYGEPFCRMLLEIILQRKIGKLVFHTQKVFYGTVPDRKGIRMDVEILEHAIDETTGLPFVEATAGYDVEPDQNSAKAEIAQLPMRTRYYHAVLNRNSLQKGKAYAHIRENCVIMIMNYDPFGKDRILYTVKRMVREDPSIPYEDKETTLYFYTRGTVGEVPEDLRNLLHYMENTTDKTAKGILSKMQQMVNKIKKNADTEGTYMKIWEREQMLYRQGEREGRKEGREEGLKAGIAQERARADALAKEVAALKAQIEAMKS